ncbi:hypothetical protein vseg_002650 [Gypsophila vaccaria]
MILKVYSKELVVPAEPTREGKLPLSVLDQVGTVSHTSVLYFYSRPIDEEWVDPLKNKLIKTLKDSLSRALVAFYPLAGRLSWIEGGRLELEYSANANHGAELIQAESSHKISDFGDFLDSSKTMFRELLSHIDYESTPIEELPLLSVQVTRFACGGICLGLQTSHVLTDGRCAFHFYKEWARLARGDPIEVAPYLDRLALKHAPTTDDPHLGTNLVLDSFSAVDGLDDEPIYNLRPSSVVLVTLNQIERLKKVANQDHQVELHGRPYSRLEVITAHVWRCLTMARDLDPDRVTAVYVICDGRSRLDPPLPSSYFGNVVIPVKAWSKAEELTRKPLSYACTKIREAIKQLTNEYIKSTIDFYARETNLRNHQCKEDRGNLVGLSQNTPDLWVTSWLNLLGQGLDFGWGHEIYAGPPAGLIDDRTLNIYPHGLSDGSVKLVFGSHYEEKFLKIFRSCLQNEDDVE